MTNIRKPTEELDWSIFEGRRKRVDKNKYLESYKAQKSRKRKQKMLVSAEQKSTKY